MFRQPYFLAADVENQKKTESLNYQKWQIYIFSILWCNSSSIAGKAFRQSRRDHACCRIVAICGMPLEPHHNDVLQLAPAYPFRNRKSVSIDGIFALPASRGDAGNVAHATGLQHRTCGTGIGAPIQQCIARVILSCLPAAGASRKSPNREQKRDVQAFHGRQYFSFGMYLI